ncbi:hypothetical protein JZ751_000264 [Albula glossodonta]|uniref:C2H2-type domain-containing protein n=1 Tax=Albula glossodonta TaxID=121402 RepID=A0A8T2PW26_9TELE|nr:hypothetical protein JZ751_000264 [Albula glossodonta]
MRKKPPNRPGIIFEVGARVEAQDYLNKWYPSQIEKIDFEEGKLLVHFERWSHRYDEWIFWDSGRLRALERPALRKEGLKDEEEMSDLRSGEEVLARWTDCRYYPAKIESVHKEGTYTVKFYDGVIRCMKRMHIKSMPEDAKGQQDWIALVRAATSAAKSKQRTGADGRDKREGRSVAEADARPVTEVVDDGEPDSARKSATYGSSNAGDTKLSSDQPEAVKAKRERVRSSLTAKRSNLSKISVSVNEDETELKEWKRDTGAHKVAPSTGPEGHSTPSMMQSPFATTNMAQRSQPKQAVGEAAIGCGQSRATPPKVEKRLSAETIAPPSAGPGISAIFDTDSTMLSLEPSDPPKNPGICAFTEFPTPPPHPSITERPKPNEKALANETPVREKASLPTAELRTAARTPKLNKHSREPIMNTIKSEDPSSPHNLDYNKFKCQIAGCSKAFRKAKLLEYHLKYYHNTDKEVESEAGSPSGAGRTRTTSASTPCGAQPEPSNNKRRRTVSTSASLSPPEHSLQLESCGVRLKPLKFGRKKRSSASISSEGTEDSLPPPLPQPPRSKSFESLHDKILKKVIEKDNQIEPGLTRLEKKVKLEEKCQPAVYFTGKKKEKDRERKERKEKDHFKMKQKKKKKKKKKSKQHSYSGLEDVPLALLEHGSSPLSCMSNSGFTMRSSGAPCRRTPFQYPRAILSVDLTGESEC